MSTLFEDSPSHSQTLQTAEHPNEGESGAGLLVGSSALDNLPAKPPVQDSNAGNERPVPSCPAALEKPRNGIYLTPPDWSLKMPMLHQSMAKVLVSLSPLHAWHKAFRQEPEEFNDARMFGQVCHEVLLGGNSIVVVDADDWRTKDAKGIRDAALEDGKLPVLRRRHDEATKLQSVVTEALERHGLPFSGANEVTAIWNWSRKGLWCQGRIDHLIIPPPRQTKKKGFIYDFKFTTQAVTKRTCENHFIEMGYDIQHAAYQEAIETIYPRLAGRVEMIFVFVEIDEPNAVRIMPLAGSMKTSGLSRWAKARRIWRQCLEKYGTEKPWPAYSDDGERAECPAWALNAQMEQEQADQEAGR